jgi:hypothetical protein
MAFYSTNCPCGKLYLSETYGGYNLFCDKDGRTCDAAEFSDNDKSYYIANQSECEQHKEETEEEENK